MIAEFKSPGEFAAFLTRRARRAQDIRKRALKLGADLVLREMRREVGRYQAGDEGFPDWPQLAARTVAEKQRKGYATPGNDRPLLAKGNMRDALGSEVADDGFSAVAGGKESEDRTGRMSPVVLWQERGTKNGDGSVHVPARSFVARAGFRTGEKAAGEIAKAIVAGLFGVKP